MAKRLDSPVREPQKTLLKMMPRTQKMPKAKKMKKTLKVVMPRMKKMEKMLKMQRKNLDHPQILMK
jgi:hypothetical protein